jgi:hypothetical protein
VVGPMSTAAGSRVLELSVWRDRPGRRETKVLSILTFIQTVVWKSLFGAPADDIQKSTANEGEYYLIENLPLINKYPLRPSSHM